MEGGFIMRKPVVTIGLVMALSITSSITAFAGWEQTGTTWKYQNVDNTYFNNGWNWIASNNDGIAECYYFNADGTILINTITPDNYIVNENGAWVVNGIVQTQSNKSANPSGGIDTSGWDTGGSTVTAGELGGDQHLSPEEEQEINEIQFNGGGIDTSGWDTGGSTVIAGELGEQHLSPEEIDSINRIEFN